MQSDAFRLATADLWIWLSAAPNISQGGQSYSFNDQQRKEMRDRALAIIDELEEENAGEPQIKYGYKGSRL